MSHGFTAWLLCFLNLSCYRADWSEMGKKSSDAILYPSLVLTFLYCRSELTNSADTTVHWKMFQINLHIPMRSVFYIRY
jgi:hypothetical protein